MMEHENIKAGKTELFRSAYGTVYFFDNGGNKVTFDVDGIAANKLFDAIKDGSGSGEPTTRTDGADGKHRNLHITKAQRFASGNGLAAYGLGAVDDDYN